MSNTLIKGHTMEEVSLNSLVYIFSVFLYYLYLNVFTSFLFIAKHVQIILPQSPTKWGPPDGSSVGLCLVSAPSLSALAS